MIAFNMQGAWWKTTDYRWGIICFLKKKDIENVDLVSLAEKLSCPPSAKIRGFAVYYDCDSWKVKAWRRNYRRLPINLRDTIESKHISTVLWKHKKLLDKNRSTPSFVPFLIYRKRD